MVLGITLGLFVLCLILLGVAALADDYTISNVLCVIALVAMLVSIGMFILRMFHWIH